MADLKKNFYFIQGILCVFFWSYLACGSDEKIVSHRSLAEQYAKLSQKYNLGLPLNAIAKHVAPSHPEELLKPSILYWDIAEEDFQRLREDDLPEPEECSPLVLASRPACHRIFMADYSSVHGFTPHSVLGEPDGHWPAYSMVNGRTFLVMPEDGHDPFFLKTNGGFQRSSTEVTVRINKMQSAQLVYSRLMCDQRDLQHKLFITPKTLGPQQNRLVIPKVYPEHVGFNYQLKKEPWKGKYLYFLYRPFISTLFPEAFFQGPSVIAPLYVLLSPQIFDSAGDFDFRLIFPRGQDDLHAFLVHDFSRLLARWIATTLLHFAVHPPFYSQNLDFVWSRGQLMFFIKDHIDTLNDPILSLVLSDKETIHSPFLPTLFEHANQSASGETNNPQSSGFIPHQVSDYYTKFLYTDFLKYFSWQSRPQMEDFFVQLNKELVNLVKEEAHFASPSVERLIANGDSDAIWIKKLASSERPLAETGAVISSLREVIIKSNLTQYLQEVVPFSLETPTTEMMSIIEDLKFTCLAGETESPFGSPVAIWSHGLRPKQLRIDPLWETVTSQSERSSDERTRDVNHFGLLRGVHPILLNLAFQDGHPVVQDYCLHYDFRSERAHLFSHAQETKGKLH